MNRKYIESRLTQIEMKALSALNEKHTTGKPLTDKELYSKIKKGELKLKPFHKIYGSYRYGSVAIMDYYDMSKYTKVLNKKAYDKDAEKIRKEFQAAADQVMLGDNKEALDLLQALQKKYY